MRTCNFTKISIEDKKIHRVLEFNQSQWPRPYVELNTHKKIEAEKNGDKDVKQLYKLRVNAFYGKCMKLKLEMSMKILAMIKKC